MVWIVEIRENVEKSLNKLRNKKISERFDKIIEGFKEDPLPKHKKHILDVIKGVYLCEFRIDKYRFYYEIRSGKIIINNIEVKGKVIINHTSNSHKSGDKKNYPRQRNFITWLKKKFKREN